MLGVSVGLVLVVVAVLVIALVQQHRHYKQKKRFRDADRYENDLRDVPYMGNIVPRAPTETTSLCPRRTEIDFPDDRGLPG